MKTVRLLVTVAATLGLMAGCSGDKTTGAPAEDVYDAHVVPDKAQGEHGITDEDIIINEDDLGISGFPALPPEFHLWIFNKDFSSGLGDFRIALTVAASYVHAGQADAWAQELSELMQLIRVRDSSIVSVSREISTEYRDENRDLVVSLHPYEELDNDEWYELAFAVPESAQEYLVGAPSFRVVDGTYRLRFKKGHDAVVGAVALGMTGGTMRIYFSETLFAPGADTVPEFTVSQDGSAGSCRFRIPDDAWVEYGSDYAIADCKGIYPSETVKISIAGLLVDETSQQILQPDSGAYELVIEPQDWISCEVKGANNPSCRIFYPGAK